MARADDSTPSRVRVRLRHRAPVRLRMHWRFLVTTSAGLLALVLVFGSNMVRPYVTSNLVAQTLSTVDVSGTGQLFDDGEHRISVRYDEAEYADMIRVFREEGEKQFIRADITIDGTLVEDVGLRLKGNSTLSSLRGDSGMGGGRGGQAPGGGMPELPEGMEPPEGMAMPDGTGQGGGQNGGQDRGQGQGGGFGGMGGMAQLSEDEPETLPWLISFEEYQEGRTYQGNAEITLRPAAGGSDTAVNEAIALTLTEATGQTTQDFTFTSFSVNGGESVPRLLVDSPDAQWADSLGNGVLYKSRAGGTLAYRGDDPTDYEDSFNQINGEGSYDLQPVMSLARFIDESSDEDFSEELDSWVDVESLAEYLALQDLISNSDDMDGPGSNYYLWYDVEAEQFTVLSWDLNLALGGMAGMGGGRFPGGDAASEGGAPGGGELPEGMPEGGPSGGFPGGRSGDDGLTLTQRFLDDDDFAAIYEAAYAELYDRVVGSGSLIAELEAVVDRAVTAGDDTATAAGQTALKALRSASKEAPAATG